MTIKSKDIKIEVEKIKKSGESITHQVRKRERKTEREKERERE